MVRRMLTIAIIGTEVTGRVTGKKCAAVEEEGGRHHPYQGPLRLRSSLRLPGKEQGSAGESHFGIGGVNASQMAEIHE